MITDVGIDLDGVLYNFAHEFRMYCSERMGRDDLPYPTHWEFYEDWGLDKDTFYRWLNEATQTVQLFNNSLPLPHAIEGWEKLRQLQVRIHVLTHRHPLAYAQTAEWLLRYGFEPDSLHFGADKRVLKTITKGQAAAIDDYIGYYDDYQSVGIKAFLMTQPWNAERAGVRRVPDLLAFAHAVEVHNEYHRVEEQHKALSKALKFPPVTSTTLNKYREYTKPAPTTKSPHLPRFDYWTHEEDTWNPKN